MNLLKEMLLIEEPSIFHLYKEMSSIGTYFVAPVFTISLILEYFGEMNFGGVVKKLLLVTIFMSIFYEFHTRAVEISLDSATHTLKKVSPRNLFIKKWYYSKVKTTEKKSWGFIQSIAVPNLNDLLATAFFLVSKVFLWLLKLIYSSVYHLTYVFSGITGILYFLGWTKDALKGTVQASLWCMIMPFVIIAILALVGNSIDETAIHGELLVAKMDTIIWLFGVTLLLLISPVISYGMIKGEGIHSFGSKMGAMVVSSGMKTVALLPFMTKMKDRFTGSSSFSSRFGNNLSSQQFKSNDRTNKSRTRENKGKDQLIEKTNVHMMEDSKTKENQTSSKTGIQKEKSSLASTINQNFKENQKSLKEFTSYQRTNADKLTGSNKRDATSHQEIKAVKVNHSRHLRGDQQSTYSNRTVKTHMVPKLNVPRRKKDELSRV